MGVSFKSEFQLRNFGLSHPQPHKFVRSEWDIPHWMFILWRAFWAIWHFGWLIRSIQLEVDNASCGGEGIKWLIYLTNHAYLFLSIQSIVHFVTVTYHTVKGQTEEQDFHGATTSWHHGLLFLLTTMCFNLAILVTILYWTFVFKELKYALSIMTHAVNSFYVLTDIFIYGTPARVLHLVYSMLYSTAYVIFSIIYHEAGGTNSDSKPYIYGSLDWRKPGPTAGLVVGVLFVALPLIHLFQFALYTLRLYLLENCTDCSCCGSGQSGEVTQKDRRDSVDSLEADTEWVSVSS